MSATVFSRKVNGPATHALVIGVGHYPHLPGGTAKRKFPQDEGMGQLRSPPQSARHLARWLVENYASQARPLATVSLLVSEKAARPFAYHNGKKERSTTPELASMRNVVDAINTWRAEGDGDAENVLLFYFCGHGIAAGTELALLLSDFGEQPNAPLDGALDFRRFHSNMAECKARQQCFFVDACRVGSTLLARNAGFAGKPVVHATGASAVVGGRLRLGPVFYSTLADAPAYADPKRPSIFTQALLEALSGAASGDEDGAWDVKTSRVQEALDFLMRQASRELGIPQAQIPSSDSFAQFTLNTVHVPRVPVLVRVKPDEAHRVATLRCENGSTKLCRNPAAVPWRFAVDVGTYDFFADFKFEKYKVTPVRGEIVRPPYWGKPLRVQP